MSVSHSGRPPSNMFHTDTQVHIMISSACRPAKPTRLTTPTKRRAALLRIWLKMRKEGHFPDPITEVIND